MKLKNIEIPFSIEFHGQISHIRETHNLKMAERQIENEKKMGKRENMKMMSGILYGRKCRTGTGLS